MGSYVTIIQQQNSLTFDMLFFLSYFLIISFDFQVSSDLVPVIYHEFTLCVQSKTKAGGSDIMLEVPVKDLTVAQLHGLKVNHKITTVSLKR